MPFYDPNQEHPEIYGPPAPVTQMPEPEEPVYTMPEDQAQNLGMAPTDLPANEPNKMPEPEQPVLNEQPKPPVERPKPITSTEGFVTVDNSYAEQHPEAVVKLGDNFYRPVVSIEQTKEFKAQGLDENQMYERILNDIRSGAVEYGSLQSPIGQFVAEGEIALPKPVGWYKEIKTRNQWVKEEEQINSKIADLGERSQALMDEVERALFPGLTHEQVEELKSQGDIRLLGRVWKELESKDFDLALKMSAKLKEAEYLNDQVGILTNYLEQGHYTYYENRPGALVNQEIADTAKEIVASKPGEYANQNGLPIVFTAYGPIYDTDKILSNERLKKIFYQLYPDQEKAVKQYLADLEKFRVEDPEGYTVFTMKGPEAYRAWVDIQKNRQSELLRTTALTQARLDAEYADFKSKVASGELILLPDGAYITKESFEKQPYGTQELLRSGGIAAMQDLNKAYVWQDIRTGKTYTQEEKDALVADYQSKLAETGSVLASDNPANYFILTPESQKEAFKDLGRLGITASSFIFPPAKALLPEYTLRDVRGIDWGIGVANIAMVAVPFIAAPFAASKIAGVAATAKIIPRITEGLGVATYVAETGISWNTMTNNQKLVSIGLDFLILGAVMHSAGLFKNAPEPPAWESALGSTKAKGRVYSGRYEYLNHTEIKLALKNAGVDAKTIEQADNILANIEKGIAAKDSEAIKAAATELKNLKLPAEIKTIVEDGANTIIAGARDYSKLIETTREFGEAELREQAKRLAGQTSEVPATGVDLFDSSYRTYSANVTVNDVNNLLKRANNIAEAGLSSTAVSKLKVKITEIESRPIANSKDLVKKAQDIEKAIAEFRQESLSLSNIEKTGGKLDLGQISGIEAMTENELMQVAQRQLEMQQSRFLDRLPSWVKRRSQSDLMDYIRENYPDEFEALFGPNALDDIMKDLHAQQLLDEADDIIARAESEGLSRDIDDFLSKYREPLSGGGKRGGVTVKERTEVKPETKPETTITEAKPDVKPEVKPTIKPEVKPATKPATKTVTKPETYTQTETEIQPGISVLPIVELKPAVGIAPQVRTITEVNPLTVPQVKPQAITSPQTETRTQPETQTETNVYPATETVTLPVPETKIKPEINPKVQPPEPIPSDETKVKPKPPLDKDITQEQKRALFKNSIAWKQGFGWWAIKKINGKWQKAFFRKPPEGARLVAGGLKSAYKTIQSIYGDSPEILTGDLGFMDITINRPDKNPGKAGAIKFKPDIENKTHGDVQLSTAIAKGGHSVLENEQPITPELPVETTPLPEPVPVKAVGINALPLSTTLRQLMDYTPRKIATEKFAEQKSLPRLLSLSTPAQIADAISSSNIDNARTEAVLKHLPDNEAMQVRFYLYNKVENAPTKGYPRAVRKTISKPKKKRKSIVDTLLGTGSI